MSPRIQSLIENFVDELTKAIQQEGAAAFAAAISGEQGIVAMPRAAARGPRAGASRQPSAAVKAPARRKGAKRTPEELETLTKTLLAAIKKTPGQRIEEIGKAIGIATKELALPVAKLFEAKAIKTTGQRRATKYFPR
jgi:hypothetical protein